MKFRLQCSYIKFYGNAAIRFYLRISCGFFWAEAAEVSSYNREQMAHKD